jgi:ribosomal protein S18 acetylase RimI-like enzyme
MIAVRAYADADEPALRALNERTDAGSERPPVSTTGPRFMDLQRTLDWRIGIWVAEDTDTGEIVGMVGLRRPGENAPASLLEGGRKVGCITSLRVAPEQQGQGIGGKIIRALIEGGREAGCDAIIVDAAPSRVAAMGLYKSVGFFEAATTMRGETPIRWFELDLRTAPVGSTTA